MSLQESYDVAIIGAGIIGPALAKTFADDGRSVLLIERDLAEPDRIVGELLQPGGVRALSKLGLRECLDGIDAIAVHGYEIFWHGKRVHIPYPYENEEEKVKFEGRSFHHGRFIMKLRDAARRTKGVTILEATAKDLLRDEATGKVLGVTLKRKGGTTDETILASLTFCCDGSSSNFRKKAITKKPWATSRFVGLELIDAKLPAPCHGHVLLGDRPPCLLYQIGTHETRALIDIRGDFPKDLKSHLLDVVMPECIPPSVQPSFRAAVEKSDRFPSMPNLFLEPSKNKTPGLAYVGDSMNMRHPLTGGGMTVAFTDVVLLKSLLSREAIPDLSDTDAVLRAFSKFHWQRKRNGSSTINILSIALYSLFAADDDHLRALQKGCFEYFKLGGQCVEGPVSLLACIVPEPMVLVGHFFAVAFYSIWVMFREMHPSQYLFGIFQALAVIWKACVVIMPFIFGEMRI